MFKNLIIMILFAIAIILGAFLFILYNDIDKYKRDKELILNNKEELLNQREKRIENMEKCNDDLKKCIYIQEQIKKLVN